MSEHGPSPEECQHPKVMPDFDEAEAAKCSAAEVQRRWPRFYGTCPDCGFHGIIYASFAHYISGDW